MVQISRSDAKRFGLSLPKSMAKERMRRKWKSYDLAWAPRELTPDGWLVLPPPPSANDLWGTAKGRMIETPLARTYKELVSELLALAGVKRIDGVVSIEIVASGGSVDADNRLKVLIDALKDRWFGDDAQVGRLVVERDYEAVEELVALRVLSWGPNCRVPASNPTVE